MQPTARREVKSDEMENTHSKRTFHARRVFRLEEEETREGQKGHWRRLPMFGQGFQLGDSLDSSLRNSSSRNDYSEDRTSIKNRVEVSISPTNSVMNLGVKIRERREVRLEFEFRHVTLASQSGSVLDSASSLRP
ncbi:hypothetical protein ALC53_01439 [Atta colombica]|uniref:Uncharacterized protein n=1 Tax=Atta colombica TaxID=520822 RepID=A0A195BTS6_9HYME|nr:hypothetical protein ALC53_01439 [Atta colombica]